MAEKVNVEELQLSQKLGAGTGGKVVKANFREQEIAVKVMEFLTKKQKEATEREIAQLAQLDHENIVKVHGMANDDENAYLLMEYVEEGSLHDYLHGDAQRTYTVEEAVRWAHQCVRAMVHLNSMEPRPMLHRDIKPQNMLLADTFKRLKICDFGTATDMATYLTNLKGTPAYMAPEVYCGQNYTDKCDVYSFGIMLWEMMSRQLPFSHLETTHNAYTVLEAAKKGDRPPLEALRSDCWEGIRQLIVRCWDDDPARRPSFKQLDEYLGSLDATVSYEDISTFPSGQRPPLEAVRSDCWEGIRQLLVRCWDEDPARRPSTKQLEEYLGSLGATVNYEDFIQVLDGNSAAVITFHQDPSDPTGVRRVMRLDFLSPESRTIRLTVPIVERETVRVGRILGREGARAAQDVGRETARAAQDVGRETARAAQDGEREVRRAAKDAEGAVRRLKKKFRL